MNCRSCLIALTVFGFGLVSDQNAQAQTGGWTVYRINMAARNYRTPVPYSQVQRVGESSAIFTSKSNCLRNIDQRVRQNRTYRTDIECFLLIYTDRYPTTPRNSEVGLLSHVAAGSYGRWEGWIIYWVPARNQGRYENSRFKAYGSASAASPAKTSRTNDATLLTPVSEQNSDKPTGKRNFSRATLSAFVGVDESMLAGLGQTLKRKNFGSPLNSNRSSRRYMIVISLVDGACRRIGFNVTSLLTFPRPDMRAGEFKHNVLG